MNDPTSDFPDQEIYHSLKNWGGWFGWLGEQPAEATLAIAWKASHDGLLDRRVSKLRDRVPDLISRSRSRPAGSAPSKQ